MKKTEIRFIVIAKTGRVVHRIQIAHVKAHTKIHILHTMSRPEKVNIMGLISDKKCIASLRGFARTCRTIRRHHAIRRQKVPREHVRGRV